jgi:hypothetical protein
MTATMERPKATREDKDWGIPNTRTEWVDGQPYPMFARPNGPLPGDVECEVMSSTHGHLQFIWNPNNPDELEVAKKVFEDAKAAGKRPFNVGPDAKETTLMPEFDPAACKMIILPKIVGG